MQYFDMHSHILPDFDDGAKTADDSLKLLKSLESQGVTNVCFTPHFYTNEMSVEDFISSRNEKFNAFVPQLPSNINVVLGAEVYVTRYLFNNTDLSGLTYGNSKYILTEFAYNSTFSNTTLDSIDKIIGTYGLIPVLPHVERYHILIDNPDMIDELRNMGVIIQSNISNYTSKAPMMKRRKMIKLVKTGRIDILGTDAHSFEHNSPEYYTQAINYISDKCGQSTLKKMMGKAEIIFNAALQK